MPDFNPSIVHVPKDKDVNNHDFEACLEVNGDRGCNVCGMKENEHPSGLDNMIPSLNEGTESINLVGNSNDNNKEGVVMELPIFHYMRQEFNEDKDGKLIPVLDDKGQPVMRRIITTQLSTWEAIEYMESVNYKRPSAGGIYAIKTGEHWVPAMLKHRLADLGHHFRTTVVSNRHLNLMAGGKVIDLKVKANMFWATASYTFFMNFKGVDEWSLDVMGLKTVFGKKFGKRSQEINRFSGHELYFADGNELLWTTTTALATMSDELLMGLRKRFTIVATFNTPEGEKDEFYDGMNAMSPRLARRLGFKHDRGQLRFTCINGVGKGDFLVSNNLGGADIIIHPENMKADGIYTTGWALLTVNQHEDWTIARYDAQSVENNPHILPPVPMLDDAQAFFAEGARIANEGEYPEWANHMEVTKNEDDIIVKDMDKTLELNQLGAHRWQARGFEYAASQNFQHMFLDSISGRARRGVVRGTGLYKSMFIPMSNAACIAVTTYSAYSKMCGLPIPDGYTNTFYAPGVGMVIPDQRFVDTFGLHGTWDQDDTAIYRAVKVWSPSQDAVDDLIYDMVLPEGFVAPSTKAEATIIAGVIRRPNGPGEYSFEIIENLEECPFFKYDPENMVTVNLARVPRSQTNLLLDCDTSEGLPAPKYAEEFALKRTFTRVDADEMVEAQAINMGIGGVANALMFMVNTLGEVRLPDAMKDVLGELIDVTQQEFDIDRIQAVMDQSGEILDWLAGVVEADPSIRVDHLMYTLRLGQVSPEVREVFQSRIYKGRATEMSHEYGKAFAKFSKDFKNTILVRRRESELVGRVNQYMVGKQIAMWAKSFFENYDGMLRDADELYRIDADDSSFVKVTKTANKMETFNEIVSTMMAEVLGFENWQDRIIGLYKWICMPKVWKGKEWSNGLYDRIVFQNSTSGSLSDLLGDALIAKGI